MQNTHWPKPNKWEERKKNHKKAAVQPINQIPSNSQWNLERQNIS